MVRIGSTNRPRASSWADVKQKAYREGHGVKVVLPKSRSGGLPPEFEPSLLSIRGAAQAVYRDQKKVDSLQVREYEDIWTVELDHHNPDTGNPLAHAVQDAPMYTLAGLALLAAVSGGG